MIKFNSQIIKKNFYEKDIVFFLLNFLFFYFVFSHALDYGRTFDDNALAEQFNDAPSDGKLLATFFYAEFHFYPIYFISHELDNFFTFFYNFFVGDIANIKVAKNTNYILHILNAYLVFIILKILFNPKNILEKTILYFSSVIFLIHPIGSQIIFNVTTRNESLSLFFSLLTFIYSFQLFKKKSFINFFYVITLYFFALCSKLSAVTFLAIIPLVILLINSKYSELQKNLKKIFPIFLSLLIVFLTFYYVRSNFVNEYLINYYTNIDQLITEFLIALKFYLRGLIFPIEHIYVYADNYNGNYSLIILVIFLITAILSVYTYLKFNDPILLIIILWLSATLSLPILFNLIETGFPLISKLTERYQYSSIPAVSIIFAWLSLKFIKNKYLNYFILSFQFLVITFFIIIIIDRSYIYKNNEIFFSELEKNSPSNVHRYSFTIPIQKSISSEDESAFLYNIYQLYSLYPKDVELKLQFMNYFIKKNNKKGHDYFLNSIKEVNYKPPTKFKVAEFYYKHKNYSESLQTIDQIFNDFDELIASNKSKGKIIKINDPEIDDVYFLKGLNHKALNQLEDSLKSFMIANLHNPLHATALYNSSIILKEMGQLELAKKHFEDAIILNPFLRESFNNMFISK